MNSPPTNSVGRFAQLWALLPVIGLLVTLGVAGPAQAATSFGYGGAEGADEVDVTALAQVEGPVRNEDWVNGETSADRLLGAHGPDLRLAPDLVAPRSPHVDPGDVANRTPQQIDDLANDAGLIPRGPDPQAGRGAYIDPVTGEQRILCHPGACPPHAHVNDPTGTRLDINGNIVSPESPAAHLPLSTEASP